MQLSIYFISCFCSFFESLLTINFVVYSTISLNNTRINFNRINSVPDENIINTANCSSKTINSEKSEAKNTISTVSLIYPQISFENFFLTDDFIEYDGVLRSKILPDENYDTIAENLLESQIDNELESIDVSNANSFDILDTSTELLNNISPTIHKISSNDMEEENQPLLKTCTDDVMSNTTQNTLSESDNREENDNDLDKVTENKLPIQDELNKIHNDDDFNDSVFDEAVKEIVSDIEERVEKLLTDEEFISKIIGDKNTHLASENECFAYKISIYTPETHDEEKKTDNVKIGRTPEIKKEKKSQKEERLKEINQEPTNKNAIFAIVSSNINLLEKLLEQDNSKPNIDNEINQNTSDEMTEKIMFPDEGIQISKVKPNEMNKVIKNLVREYSQDIEYPIFNNQILFNTEDKNTILETENSFGEKNSLVLESCQRAVITLPVIRATSNETCKSAPTRSECHINSETMDSYITVSTT